MYIHISFPLNRVLEIFLICNKLVTFIYIYIDCILLISEYLSTLYVFYLRYIYLFIYVYDLLDLNT